MIDATTATPNGYPYVECKEYRGGSDETKPTDCAPGSTYFEWDTSDLYMFDGTNWVKQFQ